MNDLLSYFGLVDTRKSASKKDLPLSKNLTVKNIDNVPYNFKQKNE